jgi:hypothetical protein
MAVALDTSNHDQAITVEYSLKTTKVSESLYLQQSSKFFIAKVGHENPEIDPFEVAIV